MHCAGRAPRQPDELALAAVRDLRNAFFLGALGFGLAAALIAWWIAGRLTQPIRVLAAQAARVGRDPDRDARTGSAPAGEVQEVARALSALSDTARRTTEAAETKDQQFALLAGSLPQIVWQADSAGRLQYLNKQWLIAGSDTGPVHVIDLAHAIDHEDCETFTSAWQAALATGNDMKVRCRLTAPGAAHATWHDIDARAVKSPGGEVLRWVGTIYDVHESVVASERSQRRLEDERAAREEAERLSRMRDEFMATVSHELRSPLSAITGWSDILARKASADETLAKAAQVIRRNAMLQAQLIDDLLDMTAVMAGKLTLTESVFDVAALAKEVTLSHLHAAQQKGVALACADGVPAMVRGDSRRISQVLSNLIGNAVKFTDPGGRVDVAVWFRDERVGVTVKDTGQGISPAFLPHVFDRLRQEDGSKSRKAGGLGIGLAIAKAVVE
ncbi:MAG: HAMP domain-containing histidine kinase, partial [Comamonadaceae bacterium]